MSLASSSHKQSYLNLSKIRFIFYSSSSEVISESCSPKISPKVKPESSSGNV